MSAPIQEFAPPERQLSMMRSGLGLVSGKGMAMLLGFGYWIFAARLYPEATVGLVGAAIAGIMLIGQLAILGVESSIVLTYPRLESVRHALFNTAFSVVGAFSLLVSIALLGVMIALRGELAEIASDPVMVALFVVMGTFSAVVTLQDQVAMAIKRGDHVIPRNALNGILSIVPLAVMWALSGTGQGGAATLFGAWVAGALAGVALGVWQLQSLGRPYRFRPQIDRQIASDLIRIGLPNHLLTLTERVPVFVTPLLITELISPEANAHWYVVWMAAWATLVIARSMSSALLAEASHDPVAVRNHVRGALRGMLALGAVGATATIILAPTALQILGGSYPAAGTVPLRILVLSFVPYAFLMTYYGVCRATARLREANTLGVLMSISLITAAAVATDHGLAWVAGSWLIVTTVFGIAAAVRLSIVVRQLSAAEQVA